MQNSSASHLKQKSDIHLLRKIWHCLGITFMAVIYNMAGTRVSFLVLLVLSLIFIPFDVLRQSRVKLNALAIRWLGPLMRKHEEQSLTGTSYLFLGTMFILLLNDRHVITLTLLFLAFGDPFASYFGIRFGKDKILGNKTLQGTLAAFAVCTLISGIYCYLNNLMTERLLIVAPISGLIGAVSELITIGKLDDNLTFPVVGSCLLWILLRVYGGGYPI